MTKRLKLNQCMGVIVDVQEYFLNQRSEPKRMAMEEGTVNSANFLSYLQIPVLFTFERPISVKGVLPAGIKNPVSLEKDFFDLTKEKPIRDHLASLNRKQVLLFGCETDVCILQSCLGLLDLGYEVFVVENLLFSSTREVDSAIARMNSAGAVFLSYKTMFHELLEAVEGSAHRKALIEKFGVFPKGIPDA
ncbi:MAG: isochorismatase family protein [Bdellovibrionota bacterium]